MNDFFIYFVTNYSRGGLYFCRPLQLRNPSVLQSLSMITLPIYSYQHVIKGMIALLSRAWLGKCCHISWEHIYCCWTRRLPLMRLPVKEIISNYGHWSIHFMLNTEASIMITKVHIMEVTLQINGWTANKNLSAHCKRSYIMHKIVWPIMRQREGGKSSYEKWLNKHYLTKNIKIILYY